MKPDSPYISLYLVCKKYSNNWRGVMQLRLNSKHIIIRRNKSKSKPYSFPIPGSKIQLFHLSLVFLPMSNMLSHTAKNELMNTLRKNICLLMCLSKKSSHFPWIFKV